ncbi:MULTISPECIES: ATP-binding cassette domain-containing protein [Nocardioides]|uniref:ATP-binding cassette domain-containing protein n=1 Tax=Nocardioides vastitatis TaxID=2568655 RepID=A0ABW0ZEN8_9ACTN|nr:ABC transporter ATP-binding protein [Nocardioides sp.]THI91374.1 ABC transporter ATP-binding protein [Nocardioides sp.]
MRRELEVGIRSLRGRPVVALALWSVPEIVPTAAYGIAVAHAVDDGFLAGRPATGLAWLGALALAAVVGAIGTRQVYLRLGGLVEPFRDDLARRVVSGALARGAAGNRDDGAVSRLTRQVEIVRDTYAGLVLVARTLVVTVIGVTTGLLSIAPLVALLVLPPFLLGLAASLGVMSMAAGRVRDSLRADEEVATCATAVFSALRDVTARGAEEYAARLVDGPIGDHAAAERALARVAVVRTLCFVVGGWGPLVVLLAAAPWLADRGLTAGALLGGLTYVLVGLQPALRTVLAVLGDNGLRYVVTLGRILDAGASPASQQQGSPVTPGSDVALRQVTFAYGPHSETVVDRLDLTVAPGDHLAVVGPSGIGKSTLAGLVCGLLTPTAGEVLLGGAPMAGQPVEQLATHRVLIPQEAYVFSGTVLDNLTYLCPDAQAAHIDLAVEAVGLATLVRRLGGLAGQVRPGDLSAGERQLVALTRAYLSPAPLVVLDEATCHLDPDAERRAEEAFSARGGTLVVIAHRISSAMRAQQILVLDGSSATVGDHDSLLQASPLYRELVCH